MITPSTVNPLQLPSLPFEWRKALPECPAIYFAIDANNKIQYIGSTVNLKQRWISHHRESHLKAVGEIRLAWMEVSDKSLLPAIEEALITWFNPPLNNLRDGKCLTSSGKLRVSLYIEENLKIELEKLAKVKKRSLSNLIEVLCEEAVQQAKKQGEISSFKQDS